MPKCQYCGAINSEEAANCISCHASLHFLPSPHNAQTHSYSEQDAPSHAYDLDDDDEGDTVFSLPSRDEQGNVVLGRDRLDQEAKPSMINLASSPADMPASAATIETLPRDNPPQATDNHQYGLQQESEIDDIDDEGATFVAAPRPRVPVRQSPAELRREKATEHTASRSALSLQGNMPSQEELTRQLSTPAPSPYMYTQMDVDEHAPTYAGEPLQDLLGIPLHPPKRKPINTPQPTEAPKQPIFTDPLLGQTFGNFKIEEKIGVGGFGAIYRATQVFLQQPIAVKVLHVELQDNTEVVERFRREARALAQLRHENIVQLSDFGLLPGLGFYIAMEFLNGQSLHERIKQGEAFTIQEIMRICESLCDVLAYVHQKGIIHRDLKPSNIIMHTDDIRGTSLKLIDFGIAAIQSNPSQQALTRIGSNLGTLRYMSPEQIIGSRHLDGRSDMYSVATILYRLLTGYIPFTANNDPTLMHQKTHDPPRPINVSKPDMHWPAAVIHFFNRALALDANQRPPTASAFWQEAKQALSTLMPQGNPAPSYTQPPPQNTPLSNGFPGPLPPMAPHPQTSLTPQHQTEQIDDLFGEAYELKPKKASTMVWFLFGLLVVLGLAGGLMVWKVFF